MVSEIDADALAVEGTLTGSLGDPRVTGHVDLHGGRVGDVSGITVLGGATIDSQALTVATLAVSAKSGEVIFDGVLPWSGTTGRGTVVAHLREVAGLAGDLPPAGGRRDRSSCRGRGAARPGAWR